MQEGLGNEPPTITTLPALSMLDTPYLYKFLAEGVDVATINVPSRHAEALATLMELTAEAAEPIAHQIDDADGNFVNVAAAFDKVGDGDGEGKQYLSALLGLLVVVREHRLSVDEVVDSWIGDAPEDADADGEGLKALAHNRALRQLAKAMNLRNEYERITLDTRVLTDIRPVFDDGSDVGDLGAAIINHTLRFTYGSGDGNTNEIHFAMDKNDLEKLKGQIDRAIAKANATQKLLTNAGVLSLEPLEAYP